MNATQLLDSFRADPEKVKELREIVERPVFKEAMAVLTAAGPQNHEENIADDGAANRYLGSIKGYARYANNLLLLATHPQEFKTPEETYREDN